MGSINSIKSAIYYKWNKLESGIVNCNTNIITVEPNKYYTTCPEIGVDILWWGGAGQRIRRNRDRWLLYFLAGSNATNKQ